MVLRCSSFTFEIILYLSILLVALTTTPCTAHGDISISRELHGDGYFIKEGDECQCLYGGYRVISSEPQCHCQCHNVSSVLREDLLTCVPTLNECPLESFENIPQVHFHQRTHFISTELEIPALDLNEAIEEGVVPFCIIVKGQYMTRDGWKDFERSSFDLPLRLSSKHGNISFEWVGNDTLRKMIEGKLVLIHLLCKNTASSSPSTFKQCVSFRVGGKQNVTAINLSKMSDNVEEANSLTKGIIIAIGLLLAGLSFSYVLISLFYLRVRRRRRKKDSSNRVVDIEKGPMGMEKKNSILRRVSSVSEAKSSSLPRTYFGEEKIREFNNNNNELESIYDNAEISEEDIYSTPSLEEEIEGRRQRFERLQQELLAVQDSCEADERDLDDYDTYEATPSALGLAIVETSDPSDASSAAQNENATSEAKPVRGMKNRRRLFFNPSYFEPEMLQSPPPSALEFLSNVRHMMAVAKHKMQMKSFQPTLIDIPEDYGYIKENNKKLNVKVEKSNSFSLKEKIIEENVLKEIPVKDSNLMNNKGIEAASFPKSKPTELEISPKKIEVDKNILKEIKNAAKELKEEKDFESKIYTKEKLPTPSKDLSHRLIVKMEKSHFAEAKKQTPQNKNTSIKRHKSLKENTIAFRSSVESLRQEIQSKLTRVSSFSKVQSLKRKKENPTAEKVGEPNFFLEARKNKVHRWLHSIDYGENTSSISIRNDKLLNYDISNLGHSVNGSKSLVNKFEKSEKDKHLYSGYVSNDESLPYQQDNEVYTIDINTQFLDKEAFNKSLSEVKPSIGEVSGLNSYNKFSKSATQSSNEEHNIIEQQNSVEEHSYEEIQYIDELQQNISLENSSLSSALGADATKYEKLKEGREDLDDKNNQESQKTDPNNFLCIELTGDLGEVIDKSHVSTDTEEKSRNKVKRNDSIVQDSLERPKVKKNLNSEECHAVTAESSGTKEHFLDPESSFHKADKTPGVRRSKTMKTFKDYKKIRFSSKSNEGKLTFFGEAINLNYSPGKSLKDSNAEYQPRPLQRKQLKSVAEYASPSEYLSHLKSTKQASDHPKQKIRYSSSFSLLDFKSGPKKLYHIYGDSSDSSVHVSDEKENIKMGSRKDVSHKNNSSDVKFLDKNLDEHQTVLQDKQNSGNETKNLRHESIKIYLPSQNISHFPNSTSIKDGENSIKSIRSETPVHSTTSKSFFLGKGLENQIKNPLHTSPYPPDNIYGSNLEQNTRDEYEKYLNEKTDTSQIKHNWKLLVNRIENIGEEESRNLDLNNLHQLNLKKNNSNIYDLEPNSTSYSRNNLLNANKTNVNIKKSNSISHQNSFKKKTANFINRSVSLHRMATGNFGKSNKHAPTEDNPKFSVYVNDSFYSDEE